MFKTPDRFRVTQQHTDGVPAVPAAKVAALAAAEWKRRYAARIMDVAGWNERAAMLAAEGGYELHQHTSEADLPNPEDEADEEMSCWTDDGGDE